MVYEVHHWVYPSSDMDEITSTEELIDDYLEKEGMLQQGEERILFKYEDLCRQEMRQD